MMTLARTAVHVWVAALALPPPRLQQLEHLLAADERERAQRFRFRCDREYFIAARGLLRVLLGRYLDIQPSQIQFCYNQHRKPALTGAASAGSALCFNLSHSMGAAVYAVNLTREIGIDLELMRPITHLQQVAHSILSPNERILFDAVPLEQQQEIFFRYWTCKEAYVKACGTGLAQQVDAIEVALDWGGSKAQLISVNGSAKAAASWSLYPLTVAPRYKASLCVQNDGLPLDIVVRRIG